MNTPWINDIVRQAPGTPQLTREQFTAKYFPQYVQAWHPDHRIRLRKDGRPVRMANAGDAKRQSTRRENIITEAYENYSALKTANDSHL